MLARGLVLLLLVANIGYLGLTLSREPPTRPTAAPPPQLGEQLVLLSERPDFEGLASAPVEEAEPPPPPRCYELGPFPTLGELQRAFASLEPYLERSRERRETAAQVDGYWVFLQAVAEREQAIELARQLSEAGVRDYYVVTGGDTENTVSLGVYDGLDNANERAEFVRELGFDAQVQERVEQLAAYWLDYSPQANARAPWERVVAGNSSLGHEEIDCF